MKSTDLKYILAYIIPILALMCAYDPNQYYFLVPVFGYIIIPILEQIIPVNSYNYTDEELTERNESKFFDFLLYLNFPIVFVLVGLGLWNMTTVELSFIQILLCVFSFGITISTAGINVAHEIGHRNNLFDQFVSRAMLLPSLYMHFNIEHNLGHHKNVATELDPATSRKNEWVYFFYFRSILGQYIGAWQIENDLMISQSNRVFTFKNRMIRFHIIQFLFLLGIFYFFGLTGLLYFVLIALISVLHLETINYIEHYGLSRNKLPNGRYEAVQAKHSWNSDHIIGRIFLYELTRHSDHHYKSTRKYQTLRSMEEGPDLVFGYPGSILLALIPPLWFKVMNKRLVQA